MTLSPARKSSNTFTSRPRCSKCWIACYGLAVRHLGASRAALIAALPPAFATLLAIPILGETPTPLALLGVALAVVGVALASGALAFRRRTG